MIRSLDGQVRNEKGLTLIELVITVAIGVVILAAFSMVFSQSLRTSQSNDDQVIAMRNLDVAGSWFIRDFQPRAQDLPASTYN